MTRPIFAAAAVAALGLLLLASIRPVSAQDIFPQYTFQGLNSPAARALRQEIMNRAILGRSGRRRGHRSRGARHASRHMARATSRL